MGNKCLSSVSSCFMLSALNGWHSQKPGAQRRTQLREHREWLLRVQEKSQVSETAVCAQAPKYFASKVANTILNTVSISFLRRLQLRAVIDSPGLNRWPVSESVG